MALNIDSNFYLLSHSHGMTKQEQNKRTQWLENTLAELESYHVKAKPNKRPIIANLIVRYDTLLESLNRR